jgi:hypothetical protein
LSLSRPVQPWAHRFAVSLFLASVLLTCPACRTFNMTEEEFQKEQRGIYDDSTGEETAWWGLGQVLRILGILFSGK